MTRTALFACAALLCTAAAPALAGEASRSMQPAPGAYAQQIMGQRLVTTCERDVLTQAAFRNEHGARPVFVTADQVVSAAGERWSSPRCMTAREQQRLSRMMPRRPTN